MFTELLAYDPATIDPKIREQMAVILKARGEIMRASAEVGDLRARAWSGETGLAEFIDIKAQGLAKLRQDYADVLGPFIKGAVDVDGLVELLPMFAIGVLSKFKVPPLLLLEAVGLDIDNIKLAASKLKGLIDD